MKRGFLNKSVAERKKVGKDDVLPKAARPSPRGSMAPDHWSRLPKDLLDAIPSLSPSMAPNQWSRLSQHLVDSITNRLNLDDLIRLGCVCRSWNLLSSALLPPKQRNPWLIVPLSDNTGKTDSSCNETLGFFSLSNGKVYKVETPQITDRRICGSCPGGWLITVHENGEIQVLHPFSKAVIDLPPVTKLPGVIGSFVTKEKELVYTVPVSIGGIHTNQEWASNGIRESYINKAIMSSSDPTTAIVMSTQGWPKKLAFCRLGKDKTWTLVKGNDNARLVDVIFYRGKFYTVRNSGHVFVIGDLDSPSPSITFVINPPHRLASDNYYLVECSGELLLVMRKRYEPLDDFDHLDEDPDSPVSYTTTSFSVSKLDLDWPKWVEVYDLGKDRALFVGFNQSFSLTTSDFPGCKGNSIYFTDDYLVNYMGEPFGGHDIGVFSLTYLTVEKCYPSDAAGIKPPPVWFTTHSS